MLDIKKFIEYGNEEAIEVHNSPELINISDIIDKLVRIAAKDTESHASDVVIDINNMENEIRNYDFTYDKKTWLFGYRECGVDHMEYVLETDDSELTRRYRTIWRIDMSKHEEFSKYIRLKMYRVQYCNYNQ